MIAAAGLGTVSEILDWDRGWPPDMIERMLAVAVEVEVRRSQALHQATLAGILSAFDPKAGKAYSEALAKSLTSVRRIQAEAAGVKDTGHADRFLAELVKVAGSTKK